MGTKNDMQKLESISGVKVYTMSGGFERAYQGSINKVVNGAYRGFMPLRIDGMSTKHLPPNEAGSVMTRLIKGASDPNRDYNLVLVPARGRIRIEVLSRDPSNLTNVRNMTPTWQREGAFFGDEILPTERTADSLKLICEMYGVETLSKADGAFIADKSGYAHPVEKIAFANRMGALVAGHDMPTRIYEAKHVSASFDIPATLVFRTDDMIHGMVDCSHTCDSESIHEMRLIDALAALHDADKSFDELRMSGGYLAVPDSESFAVIHNLSEQMYAKEQMKLQPMVSEPEVTEDTEDVYIATPKRIASIQSWMENLDITFDTLDVISPDMRENIKSFIEEKKPLSKTFVNDFEDGFHLPEGSAFEANAPMKFVYTGNVLRDLETPQTFAEIVASMTADTVQVDAFDVSRGAVHFESVQLSDVNTFEAFAKSQLSGDIKRDMFRHIVSNAVENGAHPDIEDAISKSFGVPIIDGIAQMSASSIMDTALGLRGAPENMTVQECQEIMSNAVVDMVHGAGESDIKKVVEDRFNRVGHLINLDKCSDALVESMAQHEGTLDHLPWAKRDDDGVYHGMVCVDNVFFVEDENGIEMYPRFESCDTDRARNILVASMHGYSDKTPDGESLSNILASFENFGDDPDNADYNVPEAKTVTQLRINNALANEAKSRGHASPSFHHRAGHWALRPAGKWSADYCVTYVQAAEVGEGVLHCDMTRTHDVDAKGVLQKDGWAAMIADKIETAWREGFERHNRIALTHPEIGHIADINDYKVRVRTTDPHLMDGIDVDSNKYYVEVIDEPEV